MDSKSELLIQLNSYKEDLLREQQFIDSYEKNPDIEQVKIRYEQFKKFLNRFSDTFMNHLIFLSDDEMEKAYEDYNDISNEYYDVIVKFKKTIHAYELKSSSTSNEHVECSRKPIRISRVKLPPIYIPKEVLQAEENRVYEDTSHIFRSTQQLSNPEPKFLFSDFKTDKLISSSTASEDKINIPEVLSSEFHVSNVVRPDDLQFTEVELSYVIERNDPQISEVLVSKLKTSRNVKEDSIQLHEVPFSFTKFDSFSSVKQNFQEVQSSKPINAEIQNDFQSSEVQSSIYDPVNHINRSKLYSTDTKILSSKDDSISTSEQNKSSLQSRNDSQNLNDKTKVKLRNRCTRRKRQAKHRASEAHSSSTDSFCETRHIKCFKADQIEMICQPKDSVERQVTSQSKKIPRKHLKMFRDICPVQFECQDPGFYNSFIERVRPKAEFKRIFKEQSKYECTSNVNPSNSSESKHNNIVCSSQFASLQFEDKSKISISISDENSQTDSSNQKEREAQKSKPNKFKFKFHRSPRQIPPSIGVEPCLHLSPNVDCFNLRSASEIPRRNCKMNESNILQQCELHTSADSVKIRYSSEVMNISQIQMLEIHKSQSKSLIADLKKMFQQVQSEFQTLNFQVKTIATEAFNEQISKFDSKSSPRRFQSLKPPVRISEAFHIHEEKSSISSTYQILSVIANPIKITCQFEANSKFPIELLVSWRKYTKELVYLTQVPVNQCLINHDSRIESLINARNRIQIDQTIRHFSMARNFPMNSRFNHKSCQR